MERATWGYGPHSLKADIPMVSSGSPIASHRGFSVGRLTCSLLYTSHGRCGSDGNPGNEYFSLIQLLVGGVEDINAIASPDSNKSTLHFYTGGGTVFDLYAHFVEYCSNLHLSPSRVVMDRTILNMLLSRGAELSKPINRIERIHPSYLFGYFNTETSILRQTPEQVERKTL